MKSPSSKNTSLKTLRFKSNAMLRRLRRDDHGSSLVEFALSATVLFAMIIVIFEASLLTYSDHFVANAAKDGARYAMVRGSSWKGTSCASTSTFDCVASSGNVQSYVNSILAPGMVLNNLSVTTSWPGTDATGAICDIINGTNSPGCLVRVTVSYSFTPIFAFLPKAAIPVSSTSAVTISQ